MTDSGVSNQEKTRSAGLDRAVNLLSRANRVLRENEVTIKQMTKELQCSTTKIAKQAVKIHALQAENVLLKKGIQNSNEEKLNIEAALYRSHDRCETLTKELDTKNEELEKLKQALRGRIPPHHNLRYVAAYRQICGDRPIPADKTICYLCEKQYLTEKEAKDCVHAHAERKSFGNETSRVKSMEKPESRQPSPLMKTSDPILTARRTSALATATSDILVVELNTGTSSNCHQSPVNNLSSPWNAFWFEF